MAEEIMVLFEWIAIIILICLSGLFSGLNLGLMGLDKNDLECVISGDEPNSSYAKKIKPLRNYGNWLLCTLLLGNVAVNTALSILLAEKTEAFIGFMVSTMVIVVFGEIIPQALCSRFALLIGARTVGIVWVLMALLAVVAYPIAMILDKIFGKELGTIYSAPQLRQLINIHAAHDGAVNKLNANIMKGALDLQETTIRDVMTKIDDVFWLSQNTKLTFDVLTQIFKSGHSRIPIMKKSDFGKNLNLVGMLYSKDLILLDPDDEIPVLRVMNAFKYKTSVFLSANTRLDQCLKIFVHSRQHLCMVKEDSLIDTTNKNIELSASGIQSISGTEKKLSYFDEYLQNHYQKTNGETVATDENVPIGIITLEDVIEHALQTELVDEHDVFINIRSHQQTNRLARIDWSMVQMFDHRQKILTSLPPQELQAVFHFFSQSIRSFMPKHRKCSESSIKNLLVSSSVIRVNVNNDNTSASSSHPDLNRIPNNRDPYKEIEDNGLLLYQRDKKTEYFTLILDGKCEVYAGRQGFRSTMSRWTYLCSDALEHVEQCVVSGKRWNNSLLDYVPDFTCKVIEDARVLRIKLSDFRACLQGQFQAMENDVFNVKRTFSEPPLRTLQFTAPNENNSVSDNISEPSELSNNQSNIDNGKETYKYNSHKNLYE